MRTLAPLAAVCSLTAAALVAPSAARAQRTIAHDTLSDMTPTAVTCGFCVGEAFGMIFRELPPPLQGLDPDDFPLELREVQIALADARTTGAPPYQCSGDSTGGMADVDLEVWAGSTPPTGDIRMRPGLAEAWAPDETLVWAGRVPLTLSRPTAEGAMMFELTMNRLPLVGEMGEPIVIPQPATYVRVVAWMTPGGESTLCAASSLEAPSGVPVRDADMVIANERDFLYAGGTGWLWNEAAGVRGDWAIRLLVVPAMSGRDAGTIGMPDAGPAPVDSGPRAASDASSGFDAGMPTTGGGGCACSAGAARGRSGAPALLIAIAIAIAIRRARW